MSFPVPRLRLTAMAVSAVLCSTMASLAHIGGVVYPIYKLPPGSIDVRDGHLWDWEEATPGASLVPADFSDMIRDWASSQTNPEELATRVFLGWVEEEQRVYVAVETFDDVYFNEWDGIVGNETHTADLIQFFIDGDHSGGQYDLSSYHLEPEKAAEEDKRFVNATAQAYTVLAESPAGPRAFTWGPAAPWVSQPPWTDVGAAVLGRIDGLSLVEIAVTPWDDLDWHGADTSKRSKLVAGRIIGIQLLLIDRDGQVYQDGDSVLEGFHLIYGWSLPWYDASYFVDAVLCGTETCLPGSGPVSSVTGDSWGRIKASFR